MDHDWPYIYEVWDASGIRLTTLVAHSLGEAHAEMKRLYGTGKILKETGKQKPPGKCCNKCGDHPCS